MSIPTEWPERFSSKVQFSDDGCWLWRASRTRHGYGRYGKGRRVDGWGVAHKCGWEFIHGPVPEGLELDHLCRVPSCVNPAHLEPVSHAENIIRGDNGNRNGLCRRNLHPWIPENIYLDGGRGNGNQRCKECRKEWERQRYAREAGRPVAVVPALRTHCPQGHPYDEANTHWKKDGSRNCKTCHRERERAAYHRRKKVKVNS